MNYLDTYYRAFLDYRKNTTQSPECSGQRGTTAKAGAKTDEIITTRQLCDIKTDWIEAIEQGLVHVDKAIREDRQFIRSNGEVVDIEKVKNVSRESVEHLAKHSNLIAEFEEGEEVVPERLYTVERLSDYAVYENRFLYMLLCYLRDFITVRYNKILDLEHTYNGKLSMDKSIVMPKRKINVKISLNEERKDDPFLKEKSKSRDTIHRISDILELTHAFLATPLMQEVSKVAMLKPPITKTNVLRMNHNFRGALALYEYITAYEGDGYTVMTTEQKINPFKIDMADEFSEIVLLSSFLTYEYGLNIKEDLRTEFDIEEERRKEEEIKRQIEQLKALRRRIKESGQSPEEYMLALEKVNKMLEHNTVRLEEAEKEIEQMTEEIVELKNQTRLLSEKIAELMQEIEALKLEYLEKTAELEAQHKRALIRLSAEYEEQITLLNEAHSDELQKVISACEEKIDEIKCRIEEERIAHETAMQDLRTAHNEKLDEIERKHADEISAVTVYWENKNTELYGEFKVYDEKIKAIEMQRARAEQEKAKMESEKRLAEARLIALRKECGITTDALDYTSEAVFEELERQLDVFEEFFFAEWKETKKAIRKDVIKEFFRFVKMARKRRKSPQGMAEKQAKLEANKNEKRNIISISPQNVPHQNVPPQNIPQNVPPQQEKQPNDNEKKD